MSRKIYAVYADAGSTSDQVGALLFYVLAKVTETHDRAIFARTGGRVRGRTRAQTRANGEPGSEAGSRHKGEIICEIAIDLDCDLIVMGAYGRPRLRKLVLGGITHHTLIHTTIPLLMSH